MIGPYDYMSVDAARINAASVTDTSFGQGQDDDEGAGVEGADGDSVSDAEPAAGQDTEESDRASSPGTTLGSPVISDGARASLDDVLALHYLHPTGRDIKGSFVLRGAYVSLPPPDMVGGREHCLKVTTPDGTMVMQADSEDHRISWAAALADAVAVSNGGGHLLQEILRDAREKAAGLHRRAAISAEEAVECKTAGDTAKAATAEARVEALLQRAHQITTAIAHRIPHDERALSDDDEGEDQEEDANNPPPAVLPPPDGAPPAVAQASGGSDGGGDDDEDDSDEPGSVAAAVSATASKSGWRGWANKASKAWSAAKARKGSGSSAAAIEGDADDDAELGQLSGDGDGEEGAGLGSGSSSETDDEFTRPSFARSSANR